MYIRLLDSELHCVSYVRLVPPFISLPVGCFVSTTVETVDGRRQEKKKFNPPTKFRDACNNASSYRWLERAKHEIGKHYTVATILHKA